MLSISFEVDIPTGKVGGSLHFEHRSRELPHKIWNLDAWKWYFQQFPDGVWAFRTIKIKTISTIIILCLLQPFFSSKSQTLVFRKVWNDKSSNADSNKYIQCLKFMLSFKKRAKQCLPQFLWCGHHFGTCKSLGSSPVKMSHTFNGPSICFNFYTSTERLTRLKLLKCALT